MGTSPREIAETLIEADYALKLIQNQGTLSCLVDLESSKFIYLNPEWYNLLDYTKEEMIGRPFYYFVHPEDLKKTEVAADEFDAHPNDEQVFTNRYRKKDGSYQTIIWTGNSIFIDKETKVFAATALPKETLDKVCSKWKI